MLLLYSAILSLVSIPPALFLGSWSDSVGRRSVMVLPSLLSLVAGGVLVCVDQLPQAGPLWVLPSAVIVGLTGSHVSVFLSCFSYLADVTAGDSRSRTVRMAVAESMIFVGGTVGFLLGGFLEKAYGLTAAFGAYLTCHIILILYVALWLRDPRPPPSSPGPLSKSAGEMEAETPAACRLSPVNHLKRTFYSVFRKRPGQERLKLIFLILCSFINNLIAGGENRGQIPLLFISSPYRRDHKRAYLLKFILYSPG